MSRPRHEWSEERREKLRAWGRAYYAKHKDEPAFKAKIKQYRIKTFSNPKNREASRKSTARWEKLQRSDRERWPVMALGLSRRRAKEKGLPHTIVASDIKIPTVCPVLGTEFVFGRPKFHPHSASVDRVIPALGYVPGNIRVISWRANSLKKDATAAELRALSAYVEGEL